ncbi:MAG: RNA polymerase sigma factor [Thermoanaerobaculum sp.]|nr:RNA polymerase sigma factor [Thermoanaerobaculum sp.]
MKSTSATVSLSAKDPGYTSQVGEEKAQDEKLQALMEAYQSGSLEAFEQLFALLSGELLGYLRTLTRDHHWAEDLLQDTFLQLHRARHTYLPGKPVRPWVYAIARNVFLMSQRALRRRSAHEQLAEETLPEVPVSSAAGEWEGKKDLTRLLARLPEKTREVLMLHHVVGLSFKEVGKVLGLSEGAAKVRAHRAMEQLREAAREERR